MNECVLVMTRYDDFNFDSILQNIDDFRFDIDIL